MSVQPLADPDRALVAKAAAGVREAFDALVRRHQVRIFNLARALTNHDGEAEDLAQEALIRAWRTWTFRFAPAATALLAVAALVGGRSENESLSIASITLKPGRPASIGTDARRPPSCGRRTFPPSHCSR